MNEQQLLIWAAGVIDGAGVVASFITEGPTRTYPAIGLLVAPANSDQCARLALAFGNGGVIKAPQGFEVGGWAATQGALQLVWPYLSKLKKQEFNAELRKFKALRAEYRGLTRQQ